MVLSAADAFELPDSRRWCTVQHLLGEGSQGSVFEVRVGGDQQALALKWYFDHTGTAAQRSSIAELVDRGAPDDRFLWPSEVITRSGQPSFGYLMPLRPDSFVGPVRPAHRQGRRALLGRVHVGRRARRQLPLAAQRRPLLPRHQLRQRLLRTRDGTTADLRQRQRRRRRPLAVVRARHPPLHGPRDRAPRSQPQHRHRPVLPVGAALLPADGRPPAGGSQGARLQHLGRPGREPAVRRRPAVHLRPRRPLERASRGRARLGGPQLGPLPRRDPRPVHHRVHDRAHRPRPRTGARERLALGDAAPAELDPALRRLPQGELLAGPAGHVLVLRATARSTAATRVRRAHAGAERRHRRAGAAPPRRVRRHHPDRSRRPSPPTARSVGHPQRVRPDVGRDPSVGRGDPGRPGPRRWVCCPARRSASERSTPRSWSDPITRPSRPGPPPTGGGSAGT